MQIRHNRPSFNIIIPSLFPDFWTTKINDKGVSVTRLFKDPIFISWSQVECIDLSGLQKSKVELNLKSYFFLIMVNDSSLVEKACRFSHYKKTWFAANNVLGLTGVFEADAKDLCNHFSDLAKLKGIKINPIVLDL